MSGGIRLGTVTILVECMLHRLNRRGAVAARDEDPGVSLWRDRSPHEHLGGIDSSEVGVGGFVLIRGRRVQIVPPKTPRHFEGASAFGLRKPLLSDAGGEVDVMRADLLAIREGELVHARLLGAEGPDLDDAGFDKLELIPPIPLELSSLTRGELRKRPAAQPAWPSARSRLRSNATVALCPGGAGAVSGRHVQLRLLVHVVCDVAAPRIGKSDVDHARASLQPAAALAHRFQEGRVVRDGGEAVPDEDVGLPVLIDGIHAFRSRGGVRLQKYVHLCRLRRRRRAPLTPQALLLDLFDLRGARGSPRLDGRLLIGSDLVRIKECHCAPPASGRSFGSADSGIEPTSSWASESLLRVAASHSPVGSSPNFA